MKYAFADFVFDSENLTLYKDKEVVACRHNEAKLLALFLSHPERIFSKDDILEQVWADKVVSEQAVFQNISVLRNLFGDDSIKTFSKKGYQWQLTVIPYIEPDVISDAPQAITTKNSRFRNSIWMLSALTLIVLVASSFLYWRTNQLDSQLTRIAVLPVLVDQNIQGDQKLNIELVQPVWEAINKTRIFHPIAVTNLKDYDDFFYTPQKYFAQLARQTNSNIVMVSKVGMRGGKFHLKYILKSEKGVWGAEHEAETVPLLLEKVHTQIALILQSQILDVDIWDFALRNAKLKILHHQAPDDFNVWSQLASSETQNGNVNNAILLADEMIKNTQLRGDKKKEGSGYLDTAEAFITQGSYDKAETELQKALTIFQKEKDYSTLTSVQYSYASLAFAKHDYPLIKQSLITAMQFARQAKDPLLEVGTSIYLSVMANKFDQTLDRQIYLDRAEAILDQTHQSKEHYGRIYFYAGMYAHTDILAEKNYRKVLSVLPAGQSWWERERAQAHLTDLLIKQVRWNEALDLFVGKESLSSSEEFTVSSIYLAQQKWDEAESHALNAFKLASLSAQNQFALDAALRLVDVYHQAGTPEKSQSHLQFIRREAKHVPYWVQFNKEQLVRFGVDL